MAIPKITTRNQISLDNGVYGSLPVEGFPTPDEDVDATIAYWYKETMGAGQWVYAKIVAGPGMVINFDANTGELTFANIDYSVISPFYADAFLAGRILADAVLQATTADDFTADSLLLLTTADDFTADAVIFATVEDDFVADAELV